MLFTLPSRDSFTGFLSSCALSNSSTFDEMRHDSSSSDDPQGHDDDADDSKHIIKDVTSTHILTCVMPSTILRVHSSRIKPQVSDVIRMITEVHEPHEFNG